MYCIYNATINRCVLLLCVAAGQVDSMLKQSKVFKQSAGCYVSTIGWLCFELCVAAGQVDSMLKQSKVS
jgi:hypothetical protein